MVGKEKENQPKKKKLKTWKERRNNFFKIQILYIIIINSIVV